uniref:Secreted protein n=1 Tax=Meloidogyne hapla TaxID=6305 RepID=A0A1I8AYL3_MELHA
MSGACMVVQWWLMWFKQQKQMDGQMFSWRVVPQQLLVFSIQVSIGQNLRRSPGVAADYRRTNRLAESIEVSRAN